MQYQKAQSLSNTNNAVQGQNVQQKQAMRGGSNTNMSHDPSVMNNIMDLRYIKSFSQNFLTRQSLGNCMGGQNSSNTPMNQNQTPIGQVMAYNNGAQSVMQQSDSQAIMMNKPTAVHQGAQQQSNQNVVRSHNNHNGGHQQVRNSKDVEMRASSNGGPTKFRSSNVSEGRNNVNHSYINAVHTSQYHNNASSFNSTTSQHPQQQAEERHSNASNVQKSMAHLNKTVNVSFLQTANQNGANTQKNNQQPDVQKNNYVNSSSNQQINYNSQRHFGKDMTNLVGPSSSQMVNQTQPAKNASTISSRQNSGSIVSHQMLQNNNSNAGNSRIPQPSFISKATGNMNQAGKNFMFQDHDQENIIHEQLQNPMIIEKTSTSGYRAKQNVNTSKPNSNQTSQRYLSKDGGQSSAAIKSFEQMAHNLGNQGRKSSHGETAQHQNGSIFQNMRRNYAETNQTSSTATGAPGRYSMHATTSSNSTEAHNQAIRQSKIDQRILKLKQQEPSSTHNGNQHLSNNPSFVQPNKYANQHTHNYKQALKNGEMPQNSKINKSGQNLNNLNAKGTIKQGIQTTRSTGNVNSQIVGSTTVRSTKAARILSGSSSNNNQNKASTIMNSYKMMSNVTEKIIKDHNDRQQDKENRNRQIQNKQGDQNLKRNKTSEAVARTSQQSNNTSSTNLAQSMVSQQSQKQSSQVSQKQIIQQFQPQIPGQHQTNSSMHQKSKTSEEHNASQHNTSSQNAGTSHRNTLSQGITNRSNRVSTTQGLSSGASKQKSQDRLSGVSSKGLTRKKSDVVMMQSNASNQKTAPEVTVFRAEAINEPSQMIVDEEVINEEVKKVSEPTQFNKGNNEIVRLIKGQFDTGKMGEILEEHDARRKEWLRNYRANMEINDVFEIRNPQSVIEFIPEIVENMRKEEKRHLYPSNFLRDPQFQNEISHVYRQYLVDWLAELHYKFKMWPETLYVTVGIIDKTLMKWKNFQKCELQLLGITALHIAGKYEEIYPPELKVILQVIDNPVTRQQVCKLESEILQLLDFDLVWPSIYRFMERYACIATFNQQQMYIAQMFCDFILLNWSLLSKEPSLLGAVAIYATNKITRTNRPWSPGLVKCTGGIKEERVKPLANELFHAIKNWEQSELKTLFRKYEQESYLQVVKVLEKIEMPRQNRTRQTQAAPQQAQPDPQQSTTTMAESQPIQDNEEQS